MNHSSTEKHVRVRLTSGPIIAPAAFPPAELPAATAGAVLRFDGCVRGSEMDDVASSENSGPQSKPILGLEYQVYEPMTSRELQRLAERYAIKLDVLAVDVEHSHGFVANGECSFVLQVAARHRREGIVFVDEFIDAMKRHVPIWKVPRWGE